MLTVLKGNFFKNSFSDYYLLVYTGKTVYSFLLITLDSLRVVFPFFAFSYFKSNHRILCVPLLLLPSVFPSIGVFPSEPALRIRWPKDWSFSFSISPFVKHCLKQFATFTCGLLPETAYKVSVTVTPSTLKKWGPDEGSTGELSKVARLRSGRRVMRLQPGVRMWGRDSSNAFTLGYKNKEITV